MIKRNLNKICILHILFFVSCSQLRNQSINDCQIDIDSSRAIMRMNCGSCHSLNKYEEGLLTIEEMIKKNDTAFIRQSIQFQHPERSFNHLNECQIKAILNTLKDTSFIGPIYD